MEPAFRSARADAPGRKAAFVVAGLLVVTLIAGFSITVALRSVTHSLNPARDATPFGDCRPLADPQCVAVPFETIEEVTAADLPAGTVVLDSWASPNPIMGRPGPSLTAIMQLPITPDAASDMFSTLTSESAFAQPDSQAAEELNARGAISVIGRVTPRGSFAVGQLDGRTVVYVSLPIRSD